MTELPPEAALQPEVHVRSVRRRRSDPPKLPSPPPPNPRNWLIYTGLAAIVAALMLEGFLKDRPHTLPLPTLSQTTEVRSTISEAADSLQVIVSWDLTLSEPAGRPESIRVRVDPDVEPTVVTAVQPSTQLADTLYLSVPERGRTLSGISCAAAEHPDVTPEETCTPWQYVRPEAAPVGLVTEIVIQPSGLQVDPDIGGKCAQWQRANPDRSVWVVINRTAVPDCTGPNKKPTVAQFCAFAVLPDGRRVKTANSSNNPYCDELFVEWSRELYS